jgi:hypothetical protein
LHNTDGRFSEDEWLSPNAPWRVNTWHYTSGIVLDDISESQVAWYWRKGSSSANSSGNSVKTPWIAFSKSATAGDECLRLEKRYRQFMEQHKLQVQHAVAARHRSRPSYTGTVSSPTATADAATADSTTGDTTAATDATTTSVDSELSGSQSAATAKAHTDATSNTDTTADSCGDGTGVVGTEATVDDTMNTANITDSNTSTTSTNGKQQQSQAPLVVSAAMAALSNKANATSTATAATDTIGASDKTNGSTSDVVIERNDETGQIGVSGRTSTVSYQVVADGTLEVTTYTPAETDVFVDQVGTN